MAAVNGVFLQLVKWGYIYSLFLLLMINVCFGLYEDQVGMFDWRQRYIGTPKDVYFDQTSHSSKRVYASTEANVLAALNARTGQIVWRKVFERQDGVINKLLHSSKLLLTVSGNGRVVRSWDTVRGNILWESVSSKYLRPDDKRKSFLPGAMKDHQAILLDVEDGGLVVMTNNSIRMLSQSDGTEIWEHVVNEENEVVFGIHRLKHDVVAFCTKYRDGLYFIVMKHLDMETGKLSHNVLTNSKWITNSGVTCETFASKFLLCFISGARMIAVKNIAVKNGEAFTSTLLVSLGVQQNEIIETPSLKAFASDDAQNALFQIRVNRRHSIIAKINPETRIITAITSMTQPGFYTEFNLVNKYFILAIYKNKNDKLTVDIYNRDAVGSPAIQTVTSQVPDDNAGSPVGCTVYLYKKKDDINFRLLLVNEDFSLSLIQSVGTTDAKQLWLRNEALATISNVQMIDLPPSTSASKLELLHAEFSVQPNSGVFTMFKNRIKSQIRQIQTYAEQIKKRRQYGNVGGYADEQEDESATALKRDQFNIVKIILVYTKARRLFAINSQNGNIVWSKFIPQIPKFTSKVHVIEQRSSNHFPLPPQCLLMAPLNRHWASVNGGGEQEDGDSSVMFVFNPLTGEGLNKPVHTESFDVLHISPMSFEDEKSVQVVGLVDTRRQFHIFPDNSDTRNKLSRHLNSIYVYLVNKTTNSFKGYKVRSLATSRHELYEVWSINIPSSQTILKITTKRRDETVNSVGRVLGDHTVLYKYLNPNLLGVMTMQGFGAKGNMYIYIVDAVTGHIVYQARHKGADVPAELILSEHWLIYLYYNTKGRRTEVSVVELFEGYEEKNHTAFSSLDPVDASLILSQGYLLPVSGVSSMVATSTERGITNKNLLIGLDNGHVFSLPKNFLNPRRQFKQTQMLQEEGVIPYMPELPLFPQGYINYNQTVVQIRGIHTSAAGLESTSLVFVYGLDIFYTRVTPSKMFDVLKEDFDYIFISGVLSALIIVSLVCSKLASMRGLRMAWQ